MIDDPLKLEHQICFRLYDASRSMTRVYKGLIEPYGLTYPQYIVLLIMFEHNKIDFRELSKIIDLKPATLTPIVKKLENLGYVKKTRFENDQRKFHVVITESGLNMKKELNHVPLDLIKLIDLDLKKYLDLKEELDLLINKLSLAEEKNNKKKENN